MKYSVEHSSYITREEVRHNRHKLFLFGDNLQRHGLGGQAREMRGEPNAIGIPTKKRPARTPDSYFTDEEFDANRAAIDRAFLDIVERLLAPIGPSILVIPSAGLGTGRAELGQRAPRTFAYLEKRLRELADPS
ncbi:MAG: hypothetical protein AB7J13_14355 [Pyrinomonadaceae bacterium]